MISFNSVTLIGLGHIGSSIGLSLKKRKISKLIFGYDTNKSVLNDALKLNIIDKKISGINKIYSNFIVVCTPPNETADTILKIVPHIKKETLITDVASTKEEILKNLLNLPRHIHFIGGHPIAGTEKSGPKSADANLFLNKQVILVKNAKTNLDAFSITKIFWEKMGAVVLPMDIKRHDMILSIISHLSHMVIYTLVNMVFEYSKKYPEILNFSAGGFKDFTRIAKSNSKMWTEICVSNKKNIINAIEKYKNSLSKLKNRINKKDEKFLMDFFNNAKKLKEHIDKNF